MMRGELVVLAPDRLAARGRAGERANNVGELAGGFEAGAVAFGGPAAPIAMMEGDATGFRRPRRS